MKPGRRAPEKTFTCAHCQQVVAEVAPGARPRSHCPHCLWSLHVAHMDMSSGTACRGAMEPVGLLTQAGGEWSLVHLCRQCGATQTHSIAVDDDATALLTVDIRRSAQYVHLNS